MEAQLDQLGSVHHQDDLDGDGKPDVTVIETSFATENDSISVYDGGNDMQWGDNWQAVTDFNKDTWLFDVGNDGTAQLVLQFSSDSDNTIASFYEDLNGDGVVAVELQDTELVVTESANPSVVVIVQGDWFLHDGQLNWNIRFQTDGPGVNHVHNFDILLRFWSDFLELDGQPDAELEFQDSNGDGIPEYGLYRLLSAVPRSWGGIRTFLWVNAGQHRPEQPNAFTFWPYLASRQAQNYFDTPAGIVIDWQAANISQISFSGYPIEHGFHVNTRSNFEKNALNYANFENAQAYYDLANDQDGSPELHIRHRYFAANDPIGWDLSSPINGIRWSWSQTPDSVITWDYKLGMAGRHTINAQVDFPDFSYLSVPYELLPSWVLDKKWDYATFVARENTGYRSGEGIYQWEAVGSPIGEDYASLSRYLAGEIAIDPGEAFQSLTPGWRGEFAPSLNDHPEVYISGVDGKLHLFRGASGIWQINDAAVIRYADTDADGFIDQWRHFEDEKLQAQLNLVSNGLIYWGEDRVSFVAADIPTAVFQSTPPSNHVEWAEMGRALEEYGPSYPDNSLQAMFSQFTGSRQSLTNATLRDLRHTDAGYRFILELKAGSDNIGQEIIVGSTALSPGEFAISYDVQSMDYLIDSLTPPRLDLEIGVPDQDQLLAGLPVGIPVKIINRGFEDAHDLTLLAEAAHTGESIEIANEEVDVLAHESTQLLLDWQPATSGEWELLVSLADQKGDIGKYLVRRELTVPPNNTGDVLARSSRNYSYLPAFLILIAVILLAMVAMHSKYFG